MPTVNDRADIQSAVIADIDARRELGIRRYGTVLQPHNGRDALLDAYEEDRFLKIIQDVADLLGDLLDRPR